MSLLRQIRDKAAVMKRADPEGPMALYSGNKFPSDDLSDLFRRLQQQSKDRGFWLLNAHLKVSTLVLQEEFSKLPHHIRNQVPQFDDIATLSENGYLEHLGLGPAIESALLIVLQLGLFIRRHEALEQKLDLRDNVTTAASLGVGLFPRVAVSQSTTLAEVVTHGAECLRVSVRLGLFVGDFSQRAEAPRPDSFQQILAHAVASITEESVRSELASVNEELQKNERSTSGPLRALPATQMRRPPPFSDVRFRSRVAPRIGNDSSIGYEERLYAGAGNKSLIRHYMEAIDALAGPTADTINMLYALGEIIPGVELLLVSGFTAHIKATLVDEPTRYAVGPLLLIGVPCMPDATGDGFRRPGISR
ncbi:hypothetical protein BJY00DRAFT_313867 [Aspergillus carlsbadensis]|nr:hypothetical protein BJY00DRAFT_313867 [Aspergillus carlsbadensis]